MKKSVQRARTRLTSRKVAIMSLFSALYYVLSFLPGIKAIGVASVTINIEAFIASIFGLVLGPFLGALTAFTGALLAWLLPPGTPSPTSAIFLPAPVINAFTVGLIYTRRWRWAFITLCATIIAFWFLPATLPWSQYAHIGFWVMWDKILALMLIIPAALLVTRIMKGPEKAYETAEKPEERRLKPTVIMSIVASLLIVINTWMIISEGGVLKFDLVILETTIKLKFGVKELILATASYSYLWLLLGIGILVCVALVYLKPEKQVPWNISIFILSCLSVAVGGGFVVGLFLGIFAALFDTLKKSFIVPKAISLEILAYFLLAFIGNEADNALGADMFALPLVYNGLFGMSVGAVRVAFLVAPFFYPAIRLFQAIITTLIAVPLLRNLNAAGLSSARAEAEEVSIT